MEETMRVLTDLELDTVSGGWFSKLSYQSNYTRQTNTQILTANVNANILSFGNYQAAGNQSNENGTVQVS